jgi:F-type H+-transporting ATPase subunit b
MPQLDILTFPSQIFWLFVTFFALFLLVRYVIMPRMDQILDARWERQDNNIQRTSELKEEAEILLQRVDSLMEKSRAEANSYIHLCEEKIKRENEAALHLMQSELNEKISKVEKDILRKKEQIIKEFPELVKNLTESFILKVKASDSVVHTTQGKKTRKQDDAE